MNNSKHFGEMIFYFVSIFVCIFFLCFILNLLKYDDSKKIQDSQIQYYEGKITYYDDARGIRYIEFEKIPNIEFKIDLWSLNFEEEFQEFVKKGNSFVVGYSTNTMYSEQREIISLKSNDIVFASVESREVTVNVNRVIYIIGSIVLLATIIYLVFNLLKFLRQ